MVLEYYSLDPGEGIDASCISLLRDTDFSFDTYWFLKFSDGRQILIEHAVEKVD